MTLLFEKKNNNNINEKQEIAKLSTYRTVIFNPDTRPKQEVENAKNNS